MKSEPKRELSPKPWWRERRMRVAAWVVVLAVAACLRWERWEYRDGAGTVLASSGGLMPSWHHPAKPAVPPGAVLLRHWNVSVSGLDASDTGVP